MIAALPSRRRLLRNPVRLGTLPTQFPFPNPSAAPSPFVNAMASAIASQEGYGAPNSACTSINNPGCLRAGPGQVGTSAQGFAIFPDATTGWSALDRQIQTNIDLGVDMQGFFAGVPGVYPGYAPSADSNNPLSYASFVAGQLSVPTNAPLSQLQASYDASGSGDGTIPSVTFDATGGAGIDTGDGSMSLTPILVAAGLLVGALIVRG